MAQTKEQQSLQQMILSRLEQRAERHFTWIDHMLLLFLLFYALVVIAIFAFLVWEMGTYLWDKAYFLAPLLVTWSIVASGYGILMLRSILSNYGWKESEPETQRAHCNGIRLSNSSQKDDGHETM